ncbi:MAG TPA: hypothetical protein VJ996_05140 [Solirubrobacteraceae bacterium]|nr:hypothetical protein [Solirubrobacteraceae bacterium]
MTTAPPPRPSRPFLPPDPADPHGAGAARDRAPHRPIETWLWTGPLGHLIGGGFDFGQALGRYLLARARGQSTVR